MVQEDELIQVIGDFIEMGHVENIIAMFKQDLSCHSLAGRLIQDERLMVRIGMAVLYEELKLIRPQEITLAVPCLLPLLTDQVAQVRGEAANLLGIIGTSEALAALKPLDHDPDPQVREIVADILAGQNL